jgi:hypothetical protein
VRSGAGRQRCRPDGEGGKALFVTKDLEEEKAQEEKDLPRLATTAVRHQTRNTVTVRGDAETAVDGEFFEG